MSPVHNFVRVGAAVGFACIACAVGRAFLRAGPIAVIAAPIDCVAVDGDAEDGLPAVSWFAFSASFFSYFTFCTSAFSWFTFCSSFSFSYLFARMTLVPADYFG